MMRQWPAMLLSLSIVACGPRDAVEVPGGEGQPPSGEGTDPVTPSPGDEIPCPDYVDLWGWKCGAHLEALYLEGTNVGTAWCEGDRLLDCAFAAELCEGERHLDAMPTSGLECPAGCEDDLQGGAHCIGDTYPVAPECSELTCAPGVSCSLPIEGTGTCDEPPAGGGCSCDDGVWSCFSGCPEGCSDVQPEEGAECTLAADKVCRYYDGDTCDCFGGQWRCCQGGPCW